MVNYPRGLADIALIFYEPIEQYWFLYVLFILAIVIGSLLKFGVSAWIVMLLAAVLYPGILPIPFLWGPLDQVRLYAIFLALGTVVGRYGTVDEVDDIPGGWLALVVALGLAVSSLAGLAALLISTLSNSFSPRLEQRRLSDSLCQSTKPNVARRCNFSAAIR